MNNQDWFPLGLMVESPCSPRDSQESSLALQSESISSLVLSLLYGGTLTSMRDCMISRFSHVWLFETPWSAMTNLDSILKSRDITWPTKVHLVKAIVFPVAKYSCESWTIKKAEHQRTDAFGLWCWRRLLRVAWRVKRFASFWSACSPLNFYQQWLTVFAASHSHQIWNLSLKNSGNSNSIIYCFKFLLPRWLMMLSAFF